MANDAVIDRQLHGTTVVDQLDDESLVKKAAWTLDRPAGDLERLACELAGYAVSMSFNSRSAFPRLAKPRPG
jgi:hypothetical protein